MIAAGFFLLGVVVGIAFLAACLAWDRANPALPMDTLGAAPAPDAPDLDANLNARWQG